jgi:nucleotide sugar dehydrogenase
MIVRLEDQVLKMNDKTKPPDFRRVAIKGIGDAFDTDRISIAVVGTGHIGLLLACHFAQANADVFGVDINPDVVNKINCGKSPFFELESENLLKNSVAQGRLKATEDISRALSKANVVIISVPTPLNDKGEPDLTCLVKATKDVGKRLTRGSVVVIASTVYIGATRNLILPMLEERSGLKAGRDFLLGCVPQRIDPGNRVHRLDNTPLNVAGIDERSTEVIAALFERIVNADVKRVSALEVAEGSKLVENTYRDVNIAFANELSMFFGKLGIDVNEVLDACSTKWSFQPHYPGPGVGGPCIPTSPRYLLRNATSSELRMVRLAREINDRMPDRVVDLIVRGLKELIPARPARGLKITVLGLTYKKDVGDTRDSPAKKVISGLKQSSFEVDVHDPIIPVSTTKFGCKNLMLEEAAKDADCLVFLTDHTSFKNSIGKLRRLVHNPCLLVDTKRIFAASDFRKAGFVYKRI